MASIWTPYSPHLQHANRSTTAARAREDQIRNDGEIARALQNQEEELLVAASIRSAHERRAPARQDRSDPPLLPDNDSDEEYVFSTQSESPPITTSLLRRENERRDGFIRGIYQGEYAHSDDDEIDSGEEYVFSTRSDSPSFNDPPTHRLDANGAYSPEPYHRRFSRSQTHVIPPVVPSSPVLDENGAYTPLSYQSRFPSPQSSVPFVPPVVPSSSSSSPVIPPTPPISRARDRFAQGSYRPPQPRPTVPVIPPVNNSYNLPSSRRAATPVTTRPMYWYPPGVLPPQRRAQTPVPPMQYHPPQQPLGGVVPAPPIPPIVRQRTSNVANPPPPKKSGEVTIPFIPPMPDEEPKTKAAPRPILKHKPTSALKSNKVTVSYENGDTQGRERTKAIPVQSHSEPKAKAFDMIESTESGERKTINEVDRYPDNDVDLQSGPLRDLRKYIRLLTGSFRCRTCAAEVYPKPIHKDLSTLSQPSFSLGYRLHLRCSACSTLHCRGCIQITHCKQSCEGRPGDKCYLQTCCRAGRAIAIFEILSYFDARFLAMVHIPRRPTYFEFIKQTLSSSSSTLSDLIIETIKHLLLWLPITPIHSTCPPHVHASVELLLRVSLLLEVMRIYLRAPREAWIRPGNGKVYKKILKFLKRLDEVAKCALAGLVFERRKGIERTKGIGRVIWALSERMSDKNKGHGKKRELGWTPGDEHESFCEILSDNELYKVLGVMKDQTRAEHEERKALLNHFLGEVLRWRMANALR